MKKKTGILLLGLLCVCIAVFFLARDSGTKSGENLLKNSDFELGSEHWGQDAYVITQGYTQFEVRPGEGREGGSALYIRNDYPNDARFLQEVSVESDALYHLHGYIKADAQDGWGANLSVDGVYVYSDRVFDGGDEWQEVSLYGRTGENQKYLTVFVRLGGYSGESVGEAWFDDVTLTRVSRVPDGYVEKVLYKDTAWEDSDENAEGKAANGSLIAAALVYLGIFYVCVRYMGREEGLGDNRKRGAWLLSVLLAVGLIGRIVLALLVHGYDIDTNDFMGWAIRMEQYKPWGFYVAGGFCDYPPGSLLLLWLLGVIGKLCGGMSVLLVKMPSIVCDLLSAVLLYRVALKCSENVKTALVAALLYVFNPLLLTAGAAWGQVDSVMVFILLVVIDLAQQGKWHITLPVYVAAVLTKPQALMFGPLGLIALTMTFVAAYRRRDMQKVRRLWIQFGQGMAYLVLTAALIVVPFSVNQGGIGWLFQLYGRTMSHYAQATVNSCNLYFLFGLNWVDVSSAASLWTALCGVMVLLVPGLVFAFVRRQRMWFKAAVGASGGATVLLFIMLYAWGGMTWAQVGAVLMALSIAVILLLYVRGRTRRHIPLLGAGMLTLLFTLGTMMHERYLVPAVAFLIFAYLLEKDKRILWLMAGISVMCLFNVGAVLDRNMRIGGASGHLTAPAFGIFSDLGVLEYLSAVMSLLMSMFALYLCFDLCRQDVPKQKRVQRVGETPVRTDVRSGHYEQRRILPLTEMDKWDYIIMGAATVLFAVLTFTNLGSHKAPQSSYVFTDPEEQVVLDLGEVKDFYLLNYGGIHYNQVVYTYEVSEDGEHWSMPQNAYMDDGGDCFKWKYVTTQYGDPYDSNSYTKDPVLFSGRYVRLTAGGVGLTLHEVLARDEQGNALPMTVLEGAAESMYLVDEPDTLEGEPGWYNSAYFDEIYHARTAYEHLNGLRTYEWTHPPLGKVLMSWAVAVFGMTPFGWRFAGALMGVLMLPGMYLMGKALFRRRLGAVMPMTLMLLDFMHFTQTRIATIDSFVVCFIIWSVYFMLRYIGQDIYSGKYWKTFVPLALSGLFMGLAVASKWTGCYAGVGLAVLFFWSVWRRWRLVYQTQKQDVRTLRGTEREIAEKGYRPILLHVLSCFLFFVAVPLVIYYLSYIPHFAYSGGVTVKKIIEESERMLSYHGDPGLGMDHFFYSPWYEWPLMITPMWYSSSAYESAGMQSSIMAFGNPAVWWMGAAMLLTVAFIWAVRHVRRDGSVSLHTKTLDARPAVILLCFLAQYLPWMLVPRGTYIYHYFTAVPFVILANTCVFAWLEDRKKNLGWTLFALQAVTALVLFILFFPYISGVEATASYMDSLKWFDGWLWY